MVPSSGFLTNVTPNDSKRAQACARFESLGVTFVKKPDEGTMKDLAFIQDPDGYWIEILNADSITQLIQEHGATSHE